MNAALRLAPAATLAVFIAPLLVGLTGTLLPAFGILPALGANEPSLAPWRALIEAPGFATSLRLTLTAGLLSATLSLVCALALVLALCETRAFARLQGLVTPLLATPHAAIAIGLAFLIAPSGYIVRLISPELTGWTRPPADLVTLRDPYGLALTLGLLVKEVPYLVIMAAAALGQVPVAALMRSARSMGYSRASAFVKLVVPQLWPQLRLPFYAVTAYSLSVVDQALVLAPGSPPPLAVLATRWFFDADVAMQLPAAAAAVLQLAIVLAAIALARALEAAVVVVGRRWIERGARHGLADLIAPLGAGGGALAIAGGGGALLVLALWSLAEQWPFPDALPAVLSLAAWRDGLAAAGPSLATTLAVGACATAIALALCLACLENEARRGRPAGFGALVLVYVPLIVPQIGFLFGLQVAFVRVGIDGTVGAVVWAHLVFVLPYVFLSLADPWRALDPRHARTAASLGASPWRILLAVKLPMLTRPILAAAAVGFSVSVAQYLATLFAGGGRVATITTDALTLASGADRRTIAVYAALQAALPLLAYAAAVGVPRLLFRHRRGLA